MADVAVHGAVQPIALKTATGCLANQVAVVTGAGRGIGREIACALGDAGASVVLAARTAGQLDEVSSAIRSRNGKALPVTTDVTDKGDVQRLVKTTIKEFGKIDILVNNAGANYISSLIMADDKRWRGIFDVNVFSVYLCTKAVLPHMIRAKSGRIINIASVSGKVGASHNSAYSASKAAVIGFTKAIALEVAGLGITVNAICPWHVDTELVRQSMAARGALFGKNAEEYLAGIVARSPQKRLITATEVAAFTVFLASVAARGITGQALNQCGGAVTA
jgi:NAD(P)-dependent dehydrogenase (short-subunit alcohol dehydrogenase family)